MITILLTFGISFAITFIACLVLIKKPLVYSVPTNRGLHANRIPTSGGLSLLLGFTTALIILSGKFPGLLLILIPMTIIGLADDLYHISKGLRFVSQIGLSLLSLYLMNGLVLDITIILLIIFLMTYFINAYNFMDGIDSLLIIQTIFILVSLIFLLDIHQIWNDTMVVMIGSILAFLFFNFSPAKLFLGNSGSYFLGMFVSILILSLYFMSSINIIPVLIICTIIIVDTIYVIIRRFITKFYSYLSDNKSLGYSLMNSTKLVTEAHCTHNYQKLARKYVDHFKVVIILMTFNIIWCLPLAKLSIVYNDIGALFLLVSYTPYIVWCYLNKAGLDEK